MSSLGSPGWLTDVTAIALAAGAGALLTLAIIHLFTLRRFGRRTRADQRELERLRDEVWELRAAAEDRARAEAASEAKSRFLATVSHEVRTPLNGILGMADLLTATSVDDEQKSYVEAIRASGQSLASLIEDLLDLSRIEAGKLDIVNERFAIAPLVEGVVELLAPRAHAKGLEIASFVAADVPAEAVGDAARLRQVLLNLAGNAVKFTEHGGVGLRVAREAGALMIFVIDTGPGVPVERREAIFEDFEQGGDSVARQHGGTGLGLAISRRLVERMGGELSLAHSSDSGSAFAVSLPLAKAAEKPAPDRRMAGNNVLIASPSRFEAPYVGERLKCLGANVTAAASESQALSRLQPAQGSAHDVVLVDCAFGEFASMAIAKAARQAGAKRLFVLFSPTERRALHSDTLRRFDGWLVKPVRSASVMARFVPQLQPAGSEQYPTRDVAGKLEGVSVLLAEDNEISRRVALKHLERHGARVVCAGDGAEAVRAAAEGQFDVIILDIRMPVLDGLAAARRIRAAEAGGRRTPLVALTANAFAADRRAALDAGIDYFLAKPVDPFELVALIETALTRTQGGKLVSRAS
ncbi:MAG: hypothetical protein QOF41_2363 [Methylobacteriaceae bacterium]|nr:hypothetical protein [Methylobacteriaceae bacterium]